MSSEFESQFFVDLYYNHVLAIKLKTKIGFVYLQDQEILTSIRQHQSDGLIVILF